MVQEAVFTCGWLDVWKYLFLPPFEMYICGCSQI